MNNARGIDPRLLLLSQQTGKDVVGPEGRAIGRIADLSVDLDKREGPRLVERVLVRRRQAPDLLLPWAAIEIYEYSRVVVSNGFDHTSCAADLSALGTDEILLRRDVLDTQIVDVAGQRLARVADVALLTRTDRRLELVGVEVGFGGVLRRLGLPRLAANTRKDVVAWTDLHLTSERGHTVQLATPLSAVHHLDAAGLVALLQRLDTDSAAEVLAATAPLVAAEAIQTDPDVGERVLRAMPDEDAAEIVAAMPADHAARWRTRLAHTPALLGRRFVRSRVWPRHRHAHDRHSG
ncbi:hypothetical protein BH10ACT9_BH10ACT9_56010 [soil metagenome]